MSDPCFEGYTCHGPMAAIRLRDLVHPDAPVMVEDRVVAWWCCCGVWRHATSPIRDVALRVVVAEYMTRKAAAGEVP